MLLSCFRKIRSKMWRDPTIAGSTLAPRSCRVASGIAERRPAVGLLPSAREQAMSEPDRPCIIAD